MRIILVILAAAMLLTGCSRAEETEATSGITSGAIAAPEILMDVTAADFLGDWTCGTVFLAIREVNGEYIGLLYWTESAEVYEEWEYPLHFKDGKMVCNGDGKKYAIDETRMNEMRAAYQQSAEFSLTADGILWNDLNGNRGEGMLLVFGEQSIY